MGNKIYGKSTPEGKQSLYLQADGKEYYLFSQSNDPSVRKYYQLPITVDKAIDFSFSQGKAVRKTMEKLRAYIPYIEKEYGIAVLNKTSKAQHPNKTGRRSCDRDLYDAA